MVISAVRVEIPTTAEAETSAQPDELEIAAAIAAVIASIDSTDNQVNRAFESSNNGDDTERGGWKKAAYHEAAGGARLVAPQHYVKLPAWQASRFFKVCLSLPVACLSLFLVAGNAIAEDARVELRPLPVDQTTAAMAAHAVDAAENSSLDGSNATGPVSKVGKATAASDSIIYDKATGKTFEKIVTPAASPTYRSGPGRAMYSQLSPAHGYPFVNGRPSGSANNSYVKRQAPAVVTAQDPTDDQETTGPASTATTRSTVSASQGYTSVPTNSPASSYGSTAPSSAPYSAPTASAPSSVSSVSALSDPSIQALNQATSQLNPAFLNKKTIVKIGLYFANTRMDLAAIDGAQVRDATSGALVANLRPSSRWDLALQTSARSSQLALTNKRTTDAAPAVGMQDGIASNSYGESGKYRNVAFFPGAGQTANPASIRLPLRLLGLDSPGNQSDPLAAGASNSGYIVSSRQDEPNHVLAVNGKLYRGAIWLRPVPRQVAAGQYRAAAFDVINLVDVEDYLLSVVPSEMPSSWPVEALKAQAVAARSYAIANLGKHGKEGYDLRATIDDQVYSGVSTESDNSNLAVAETTGLVLKHEGKPITAFFHSTSGGSTEFSEHVWGKPLPYLQSVPDFDDASPHFSWTKKISVDDLERAVGQDIGRLLSLSVVSRTGSNRAQYLLAQGSTGSRLVSGENMRKLFKLPSTLFNVGSETNTYIFAGRGYGHGLGMSQYGAKALAERGCNAAQILSYYYKDVTVDYVTATPGI